MHAPLRNGRELPAFVTWLFLACLLTPAGLAQEQPQKLLNPFAGDPEAVKEGRKLWLFLGCSGCHGLMGGGGMGAPVLDDTWRFGSDDGTLYKLIKGQVPGQTMQSYPSVTDQQLWQLLSYVRSLYKGDPGAIDWALAPPPDAAPAPTAPPVAVPTPNKAARLAPTDRVVSRASIPKVGKASQPVTALYDAQCAPCHGPAGAGDGPLALSLKDEPSDWTAGGGGLRGLRDQELFDVIANGGMAVGKSTSMPASPKLSTAEIWGLVAHVKSLEGKLPPAEREPVSAPEAPPIGGEALKWGSALDWAIALTVGVSALILIGILASLVVYRGRQTEGNALWVHFVSLGLLPVALLAVGNYSVLEYAKEERFCGACHLAMKPYIDDLHDAKSRSLAARHFQHRFARGTECYSCHANYGVHGTFEAKLRGLEDVYKYVTRSYQLPLAMREPYPNVLCLKCHGEAKRFVASFGGIHVRLSDQLRSGALKCVGCHKLAHDIPRTEPSPRPVEAD